MSEPEYFRTELHWDGSFEYPPEHVQIDAAPGFEPAPGVTLRPFFGKRLMMSHVTLAPGAVAPLHQHPQEQLTFVLSGEMEFTVGDLTRRVGPGEILSIPPMVPHMAVAGPEGCVEVDMFSPIREGFRKLAAEARKDGD
jgi:quercetin dioxygenase-like cupin family protein